MQVQPMFVLFGKDDVDLHQQVDVASLQRSTHNTTLDVLRRVKRWRHRRTEHLFVVVVVKQRSLCHRCFQQQQRLALMWPFHSKCSAKLRWLDLVRGARRLRPLRRRQRQRSAVRSRRQVLDRDNSLLSHKVGRLSVSGTQRG